MMILLGQSLQSKHYNMVTLNGVHHCVKVAGLSYYVFNLEIIVV